MRPSVGDGLRSSKVQENLAVAQNSGVPCLNWVDVRILHQQLKMFKDI
jgi:hypothetical protein